MRYLLITFCRQPGGQIDLVGGAASGNAGVIIFKAGVTVNATEAYERMRIDASGNLLVGTTSSLTSGQIGRAHV